MQPELNFASLSEFAQSALCLDEQMREFERLGRELGMVDLESDKGFARGGKLLTEATSCRERLQKTIQEMARKLAEARQRNEQMEQQIAARTQAFELRQGEVDRLMGQFKTLSEGVSRLNEMVKQVRPLADTPPSAPEAQAVALSLNQASESLNVLVEEAKQLVAQARSTKMKGLERNVDSLHKSLQAARNRLQLLAQRKSASAVQSAG